MITTNDWCYDEYVESVEEPLPENIFWKKVIQINNIINRNDPADNEKLFELSQELGV